VNDVLGIAMPKVILDQAQVVATVGEREAAGVQRRREPEGRRLLSFRETVNLPVHGSIRVERAKSK
jgi:hypothetical protein